MKKIREVTIDEILVFNFPVFHMESSELGKPIESFRLSSDSRVQYWNTFHKRWGSFDSNITKDLKEHQRVNANKPFFIFEEEEDDD